MKPEVKYDLKRLDTFVNGLSKKYFVQVGIMGGKNMRPGDESTNAGVGAKHEFGSFSDHIPQRSFLRMPLFMMTARIMKDTSKNSLTALVKGDFKQVFANLGIACETVIGIAFDTRGLGTWKPLTQYTIDRKISNNPAPLINTSQLRKSITSKVENQ
jgi:hypothetical protein